MSLDIDIVIIRNAIYLEDVNIIGFTMLLVALKKKAVKLIECHPLNAICSVEHFTLLLRQITALAGDNMCLWV